MCMLWTSGRLPAVLIFLVVWAVGCSGPSGPTIDPTGHWVPVGATTTEPEFDIRVGAGGGYVVESLVSDLVQLQMSVNGNSFTMTGEEVDDSGDMRVEYLVTGAINGDTMTGNFRMTAIDVPSGDRAILQETQFTANRQP